ncbi:hypothetical protein HKCCE4037_09230 [Rhodobacterales bacterium HKCCE4037]|nr:hypothetical protein [Rhodobacterales bacterium HKCCE4037]
MTARRWWLALLLLTAALYGWLAWLWFTQLVPGADGLTPFDGRILGYSFAEAEAFLAALSADARVLYLTRIRHLDTIFPICLALLLAAPLWRLPTGWMRALAVIPILYLVSDLAENAAVAGLLRVDPAALTPDLVTWASTLTQVKYAALGLSVFALGLVFVRTRRS